MERENSVATASILPLLPLHYLHKFMSDDDLRTMVKEWLQVQNRKSYQLAEEIGIRPQTFYAQMSVRKISAHTKKALFRIIPDLVADPDLNASAAAEEYDPEKLKIKEWLRAHGKTRQWLAEQCRVSIRTVHTWFAVRGRIPVTQSLFIDKLMSEGEPWKVQLSNTIPVNFSETEMSIIRKFQERHPDIDLPAYGMYKILELCVNILVQDEHTQPAPSFGLIRNAETCAQQAEQRPHFTPPRSTI